VLDDVRIAVGEVLLGDLIHDIRDPELIFYDERELPREDPDQRQVVLVRGEALHELLEEFAPIKDVIVQPHTAVEIAGEIALLKESAIH